MGCDIHPFVEVRRDGRWVRHDWQAAHKIGQYEDGSDELNYDSYVADPFYIGRNYDLFAMLADVRNGRGFAGVITGDGFTPIAMPKGMPPDASPEVLQEYCLKVVPDSEYQDGSRECRKSLADKWLKSGSSAWVDKDAALISGPDWHSASWLFVTELDAYDWRGQTTKHRGWVDAAEYQEFKAQGRPNSWYGGIDGDAVKKVGHAEMERLIAAGVTAHAYTAVEWANTYADSVKHFLAVTLPALRTLGAPEDVRLVFFFDN